MMDAELQDATRLHRAGRLAEAARIYDGILRADPAHFGALHGLGVLRYQSGAPEEAARLIAEAIAVRPEAAEAHFNFGSLLQKLKRFDEALAAFDRAIALKPDYLQALVNRAGLLAALGRQEEALAGLDRVLALKPGLAEAWAIRGTALLALGRPEDALAASDRALAARPESAALWRDRAAALAMLQRADEALAAIGEALQREPSHAGALRHRADLLHWRVRFAAAARAYEAYLAVNPGDADGWNQYGMALAECRRREDALAAFGRSLALDADNADVRNNRANMLFELKRFEEAAADYARALEQAPDLPFAEGLLVQCRLRMCDWQGLDAARSRIADGVREGRRVVDPLGWLSLSNDPQSQRDCARIWIADGFPPASEALAPRAGYGHRRLRVAYLSGDFRPHPVAFLVAGLFACHDRENIKSIGIALSPPNDSEVRARIAAGFERFIEAHDKSDGEIALLMREAEIDIAVDLMGFTEGCRTGILALRPAPVQVNFLGTPGTMGAPYMDYIIADRILVPEGEAQFYDEKIVYLPDTYQPNDLQRRVAARTPTRAEAGLPETGFVFCCFNNCFKIGPQAFDIWMRLLKMVPGSVLWLLQDNEWAAANLRREAQARGVAPERLVFAERAAPPDHLARQRLADLFLDTLPYNAHTTASDALWVGLPVVTLKGESFAGRVAASLLQAAGLPELVTESADAYEALALRLARDPAALAGLKAKLTALRDTAPLFDTPHFARHLEAAYRQMQIRLRQGLAPESFAVADAGFRVMSDTRMNDARLADAARLRRAGKLAEAAEIYGRILAAEPRHFEALHALGLVRYQGGAIADAERLIGEAVAVDPTQAEAFYNRACLLRKLDRAQDALAAFDRALALKPGHVAALVNRAGARLALARPEDALADLDAAAALRPGMAEIWNNRGAVLVKLGRFDAAIASYDRAFALKPDAESRSNRATAQLLAQHYAEALADFDAALAAGAQDGQTWSRRGAALFELGRHEDAGASFDAALARAPDDVDMLFRRANARLLLRRFEDAARDYEAVLARAPDYEDAPGSLAFCRLCQCDWEGAVRAKAIVAAAEARGVRAVTPFQNIALGAGGASALATARRMAAAWPEAPVPARRTTARDGKIRVAYVSANFRQHAVAELLACVIERHDPARFETVALALGPADDSPMRARLIRAFTHFEEAGGRGDSALAEWLRATDIDIAVDLMGFTEGCRPGIFAARPAPVQVNFLGFPGTMGAPFMDYIVADPVVIPPQDSAHYAENIVRLPHTYLPNDGARAIGSAPSRAQAGLPPKGFVFASFNNSYKFSDEFFSCWMRLLGAVPGSVLWLPETDGETCTRLRAAAAARGVTPERIVFAPRAALMADHLARLSQADLFLDTLPYNAHSTACDALWAGLPVLSCCGETFAGRVAASLVLAAGLPELVTASLAEYEAQALRLARDAGALKGLRDRLARMRTTAPLFDTARFTRNLEAAFTRMRDIYREGSAPRAFTVEEHA